MRRLEEFDQIAWVRLRLNREANLNAAAVVVGFAIAMAFAPPAYAIAYVSLYGGAWVAIGWHTNRQERQAFNRHVTELATAWVEAEREQGIAGGA